MTSYPDGLVDFDDLPDALKPEARAVVARISILTAEDAPLFAFRITRGWRGDPRPGRVSPSRKDLRLSDAAVAAGATLGRR